MKTVQITTYRIFQTSPETEFHELPVSSNNKDPIELIFLDDAKFVVDLLQKQYRHTEYRIKNSHGEYVE